MLRLKNNKILENLHCLMCIKAATVFNYRFLIYIQNFNFKAHHLKATKYEVWIKVVSMIHNSPWNSGSSFSMTIPNHILTYFLSMKCELGVLVSRHVKINWHSVGVVVWTPKCPVLFLVLNILVSIQRKKVFNVSLLKGQNLQSLSIHNKLFASFQLGLNSQHVDGKPQ